MLYEQMYHVEISSGNKGKKNQHLQYMISKIVD